MSQSARSVSLTAAEAREIVATFQSREIVLLQGGDFEAWLAMMSPDVSYRMPVTLNTTSRKDAASGAGMVWYDDTYRTLKLRVTRLLTGLGIEETLPGRTRYFVQNLEITPVADSQIVVSSNLLVHRTRRDFQTALFSASRDDELALRDGKWLLASRTIVLDHTLRGPVSHQGIFF